MLKHCIKYDLGFIEGRINVTQTANSHLQSMVDAHGLVIFPMSGNNSFKTPDFADLASLLKHGGCIALSHHVFMENVIAKPETSYFVFSFQRILSFPNF